MQRKEQIAQFLHTNFPMNREGVEELIAAFQVKRYPKLSSLLNESSYERKLRFLNTGAEKTFEKPLNAMRGKIGCLSRKMGSGCS